MLSRHHLIIGYTKMASEILCWKAIITCFIIRNSNCIFHISLIGSFNWNCTATRLSLTVSCIEFSVSGPFIPPLLRLLWLTSPLTFIQLLSLSCADITSFETLFSRVWHCFDLARVTLCGIGQKHSWHHCCPCLHHNSKHHWIYLLSLTSLRANSAAHSDFTWWKTDLLINMKPSVSS